MVDTMDEQKCIGGENECTNKEMRISPYIHVLEDAPVLMFCMFARIYFMGAFAFGFVRFRYRLWQTLHTSSLTRTLDMHTPRPMHTFSHICISGWMGLG